MNRVIDYESALRSKQLENINDLRKNINSQEYVIKMKKFAENNFLNFQDVVEKALTDDIFSLLFVKNAKKQSIHEAVAANFISENKNINNFRVLPKSGKNALYLYKGKVIDNMSYLLVDEYSKSIDFRWEVKVAGQTLEFYASHKYTQERGGGQDHQLMELDHFLNNSRKNKDSNKFFIAICDGDYYNELPKRCKFSKLTKLKNKYKNCNNTFAINSNELDSMIERIISIRKEFNRNKRVKNSLI